MDPRPQAAARRLARVDRLIAVTGGKGGIGKTLVSACLALCLAQAGRRTGLLDLDLTGPCSHLVLGANPGLPQEDFGVVPPVTAGIRSMSISYFAGERPAPLRGTDVSNALIELLAITQWGELDFLVIDMPPGLGDALLDAARLLPKAEFLVVATASRVVVATVHKTLELLVQLRRPILGLVENMQLRQNSAVADLAAEFGLRCLAALPFDEEVEEALGHPEYLLRTRPGLALQEMTRSHLLCLS
jgi:ATP-binding protein involved in chromosome partitioning